MGNENGETAPGFWPDSEDPDERLISDYDRDLLGRILRNDNDRLMREIRDAPASVVFEVGFEGGGLEITQYLTPTGKAYFLTSGTNMRLDDNDDEEWAHWEDMPTASFEGSLAELRLGKDILCLRPRTVHPDHRDAVRKHIASLLAKVTFEDRQRMGGYLPASADEWLGRLK